MFTYDNGTSWSSYVDTNFMPIFFNANLTIMFPDDADRKVAQDVCYKVNETDPDPTQRRLCYFDLKATGQTSLALGTSNAKAEVDNTQTALGNYYFFYHTLQEYDLFCIYNVQWWRKWMTNVTKSNI